MKKSSASKVESPSDHWQESFLQDLYQSVSLLQNADECRRFFEDLCTPAELRSMADRWRVAQALEEGLAYRSINENTGVSTTTITRVARAMSYGTGGYSLLLDRRKEGNQDGTITNSNSKGRPPK